MSEQRKFEFLIDKNEKKSLVGLMKDPAKKAKFEENLKLNFFRYHQDKNPEDYDCRLYNKDGKFIIKVTKI